METAPLTSAHAHAREATHSAPRSIQAAVEKHTTAADDFAKSALHTQDPEALRVLKLLEEEHRRLAILVQPRAKPRIDDSTYDVEASTYNDAAGPVPAPETPKRRPSPVLERRQARPPPSAIVSNLASARGIPTAPQRHMKTKAADDRATARLAKELSSPSKLRQSIAQHQEEGYRKANPAASQGGNETHDDDAFQRFYSGFEGLWSKLSAPLAFAGLPLVAEAQAEQEAESPGTSHHRKKSGEGPDISSIYSKAAMRAIQADGGPVGNPQESFYVVPSGARDHRRIQSYADEADEDDMFEDARESPTSPKLSRHGARATPTSNKTAEELEMENASLKSLTDNLSKRLWMWESSAQQQTAAMQQSIRSLQPSTGSSGARGVAPPSPNQDRVREMEEQLKTMQKEMEQQARENAKLKTVVVRYRERWASLKEGARVRREGAEKGTDEAAPE